MLLYEYTVYLSEYLLLWRRIFLSLQTQPLTESDKEKTSYPNTHLGLSVYQTYKFLTTGKSYEIPDIDIYVLILTEGLKIPSKYPEHQNNVKKTKKHNICFPWYD